ncbi:SMP-30/gluconolactonase/LRE family protein [Ancylomarina sp. 16SWW S1-10-2]|uniref:Vgb family protein n=1 Tax=Ancylomarina sp. 16SWW S1-10-2 TaxID=2499681 RepID=UPI001E2F6E52|nr:SMP-30/gluconolactonase/LRE family protein [Ancylomarina sp. 16SWW S1-10-2]
MNKFKSNSISIIVFLTVVFFFMISLFSCSEENRNLNTAKLFVELPDYCPTPDAFALAPDGSLTLSCPNYAEKTKPGVLVRITKNGVVSKLAHVEGVKLGTFSNPMGIDYAPDGSLFVCASQGANNGRILRMVFNEGKLMSTEVIASGINGPNGLKYYDGAIYVTTPKLPMFKTEKNTSGVYRFLVSDRNIEVRNDSTDVNLIFTSQTQNPRKQFGLDGLAFDNSGHLFVADFGDATIFKLNLDTIGKVIDNEVYACLPDSTGIDGMTVDEKGNLYIAGFSQNQIWKIDVDKKVSIMAQYPDNNGANGELDQPVDVVIFENKLLVSNFDLMTEAGMVNKSHGKPYTLSFFELVLE